MASRIIVTWHSGTVKKERDRSNQRGSHAGLNHDVDSVSLRQVLFIEAVLKNKTVVKIH